MIQREQLNSRGLEEAYFITLFLLYGTEKCKSELERLINTCVHELEVITVHENYKRWRKIPFWYFEKNKLRRFSNPDCFLFYFKSWYQTWKHK